MLEYLLKVSFVVGVVFLFYKFVLQQESFFATNRFYLLCGIVLAFALPFVSLPKLVSNQGFISTALQAASLHEDKASGSTSQEGSFPFNSQTWENATPPAPLPALEPVESKPKLPDLSSTPPSVTLQEEPQTTWLYWIGMFYLFGVGVCTLNFLFQIGSTLYKALTSEDKIDDGTCVIVNTTTKQAPCSFFRYIFIHPDEYDYETYEQIIAHEKIHVKQGHTYDLLLAELAVNLLWFNPLMWLFKKEVEKNLEYQTDAHLLEKEQVSKKQYQFNLLQIACPNKPLSITTNYNQSLLKQRIFRMNAKKSTPHAFWKYTFLAPVFFGTLLLLNEPASSQQALAHIPGGGSAETQPSEGKKPALAGFFSSLTDPIPAEQDSPTTRAQPDAQTPDLIGQTTPQRPSLNSMNITGKADMSEGYWYSHKEGNDYCLELRGKQNTSTWSISRCYPVSQFTKKGEDVYQLTREAGTLEMTGNLAQEVSQGKYTFREDASFSNFLSKKKIDHPEDNFLFHLFLADVNKKYVDFLTDNYDTVSGERLQELAIHGVTQPAYQEYLALFKKHSNTKPSISEVVEARIHGITQEYVQQLQEVGYKDLPLKKMMEAKIHGVNASYVDGLRQAGFPNLPMDKLIEAKIHGISPAYVKEVKALGFGDLSLNKIIELKIHGITTAYIQELKSAGFDNLPLDKITEAKIFGIRAQTIKDAQAYGFKDLSLDKLIQLRIHGVNEAFLEGLNKVGFKNLDVDKAIEARIHGVTGDFIANARKEGYNLKTLDEYINVKIMGMARQKRQD
ncbi:M56 family metallopeptidase [Sabulibacter ruber]|uniref:M56 family metallopeptidase n=1 Tax=Sabulibacter ruber TaxID=2811901 RepID=UPI001A958967|nr:M56 family metallopeptidase [Sabulibacter ruber]